MSNDYFVNPDTITTGQYARSRVVNAILDAIETGFSLLPAQASLTSRLSDYGGSSGAADAYTATLPAPVPTAYVTGLSARIIATATNTGASTINVNGLGAKDIRRQNGDVLSAGDLIVGQVYTLHYNGTHFLADLPEAGPAGTVSAAGDGSVSAPGIAWALDSDTGLYRAGTGETRVSSNGVDQFVLIRPTQAEAETATDNFRPMTPLRVAQRVTSILADQSTAEAGTSNTTLMTPLRAEQHTEFWMAANRGHFWNSPATIGYPGGVTAASVALTSQKIVSTPIFIGGPTTVDDIQISVTAGGAGKIRLGIYEDNAGAPGDLLVDAGTASAASTGQKVISGLAQALVPGWYWLGMCANGGLDASAYTASARLVGARGYEKAVTTFATTGGTFAGGANEFRWKPDGTKAYSIVTEVVTEYNAGTPWDLSTLSLSGTTFDASATLFGSTHESIAFSSDGTKLYLISPNDDYVYQFDMSPAWDLTTAAYTGGERYLAPTYDLTGVGFNSDGSIMYLSQDASAPYRVRQYTLSTPWRVNTASYASKEITIPTVTDRRNVTAFSSDTRLLVGHTLYKMTAGDLATAEVLLHLDGLSTTNVGAMDAGDGKLFFKDLTTWRAYTVTESNIYAEAGLPDPFPSSPTEMTQPFNIEVAV